MTQEEAIANKGRLYEVMQETKKAYNEATNAWAKAARELQSICTHKTAAGENATITFTDDTTRVCSVCLKTL